MNCETRTSSDETPGPKRQNAWDFGKNLTFRICCLVELPVLYRILPRRPPLLWPLSLPYRTLTAGPSPFSPSILSLVPLSSWQVLPSKLNKIHTLKHSPNELPNHPLNNCSQNGNIHPSHPHKHNTNKNAGLLLLLHPNHPWKKKKKKKKKLHPPCLCERFSSTLHIRISTALANRSITVLLNPY